MVELQVYSKDHGNQKENDIFIIMEDGHVWQNWELARNDKMEIIKVKDAKLKDIQDEVKKNKKWRSVSSNVKTADQ